MFDRSLGILFLKQISTFLKNCVAFCLAKTKAIQSFRNIGFVKKAEKSIPIDHTLRRPIRSGTR